MSEEGKPVEILKRKPCFNGEHRKRDKYYKLCSEEVKSPFSWWCNPTKKGGYQFIEEHPSFSHERYRRIPWQPTISEKRDDTWPYNCDPLRCATSKVPSCLHKIIYGDNICLRKPCTKYRLKAPLYALPKILGHAPECRPCCWQRIRRRKPIPFNQCRIHCEDGVPNMSKNHDQLDENKYCKCTSTTNFSVQPTLKEFKDSCCDPTDDEKSSCASFEVLKKIDAGRDLAKYNHLLEASYSCPAHSKTDDYPVCNHKKAFKDYCSCQQLKNGKRMCEKICRTSDACVKYLRCFDLEKDTLEYIKKCICDSQKEDEHAPCSTTKRNSSTKVLFQKLLDEKFDKMASILEISENMRDSIGKGDLFTLLANNEFLQDIEEGIKARYREIFSEKLERLNVTLRRTEKMRNALDKDELLEMLDGNEKKILQGPIDKTLIYLNRKLFVEKLERIHSIIELTEKMKAAMEAEDFEGLLFGQAGGKPERKEMDKNKRVDTIFDGKIATTTESSDMNPTPPIQPLQGTSESIDNHVPQDKTGEKIVYEDVATAKLMMPNVASTGNENSSKKSELENLATVPVPDAIQECPEDLESKSHIPPIMIEVDGDDVEVGKTPFGYGFKSACDPGWPSFDRKVCFDSKPWMCAPCPSSYFEIDSYLQGLKALITTYDPFLSPYSPMRYEIWARRMRLPKKVISTKKCFPMSRCVCSALSKNGCAENEKSPISAFEAGKTGAFYQVPCHCRGAANEIKKWKENWTGRRMTNCNNTSRRKCPYGIH